jgi:hypothetical protein
VVGLSLGGAVVIRACTKGALVETLVLFILVIVKAISSEMRDLENPSTGLDL